MAENHSIKQETLWDVPPEKRCARCKKWKKYSEFHKTKYRRSGIQDYCKPCRSEMQKHRIRTNQNEYDRKRRQYYETSRWVELKKHYGVTKEQYERMDREQDGKCAICGNPETFSTKGPLMKHPTVRKLAVDHCHATGKVRGLLCTLCNNGLGYFKDNQEVLKKAIAYLRYHLEK